jgi:hypothetical protein
MAEEQQPVSEYVEPTPPMGYKYVYICLSNVSKIEGDKPWENEAAAFVTQNDRTHVEIMFWQLDRTYTVTRKTKTVRRVRKIVKPFYDVYRIKVTDAEYLAMMNFLDLQVNKPYDDEEFFCFVPSVFLYTVFCRMWAPCVSEDKITCTRLVGGALKSAGIANEYTEKDVYYMTCNDIERIIAKREAVLLEGMPITASPTVGIY